MNDVNKHIGTGRLGVEPKFFTGENGSKIGKLFAMPGDMRSSRKQ